MRVIFGGCHNKINHWVEIKSLHQIGMWSSVAFIVSELIGRCFSSLLLFLKLARWHGKQTGVCEARKGRNFLENCSSSGPCLCSMAYPWCQEDSWIHPQKTLCSEATWSLYRVHAVKWMVGGELGRPWSSPFVQVDNT